MRDLAINQGSTSTKVAVYEGNIKILSESVEHSAEAPSAFNSIVEQLPMQRDVILDF